MIMSAMMSSESGYKFRSEINRKVKLRNVYSAQVSGTICQECETCFTEEPQTTNDEACNRSHTRKVNRGDPPLRSQKETKAQLDPTKKNIFTIEHKFSQQNPRLKLNYNSRFVDSQNRSSCSFMFFSTSRFRTRVGCANTGYSRSVFRNTSVLR